MIRTAILYHVYSGHLFFTAAALFVVGVFVKRLRLLTLLAIPLAALSGTPMALWIVIPLAVALATYFVAGARTGADDGTPFLPAAVAVALVGAAVAFELPYHVRRPAVSAPTRLFVIGDSLASGGFGESAPWPSRLGATNLARPADNAATARDQLKLLPWPASGDTVIVEIGGNDMLEGRPAREFAGAFDEILTRTKPRRAIVLEIPLLPGAWRYGAAQRRLTRQHDAALIPKRVLARTLADSRNTSDGLHLTERGHAQLARDLARYLGQ